jgi:hypothetical protein
MSMFLVIEVLLQQRAQGILSAHPGRQVDRLASCRLDGAGELRGD